MWADDIFVSSAHILCGDRYAKVFFLDFYSIFFRCLYANWQSRHLFLLQYSFFN